MDSSGCQVSLESFGQGFAIEYSIKTSSNCVYIFVLKGYVTINDTLSNERDGLGIWNITNFSITANSADGKILLMDIPMS